MSFPEIVEALDDQSVAAFVIDGEVAAFAGSRTSFARLQPRIQVNDAKRTRASGVPVHWHLRHPRYLGLRRDKRPEDVVREQVGAEP